MCGIAGFTGCCDSRLLESFQKALHHRGPDQSGILCERQVGLSSNRLAIIDLPSGGQPIFNEDHSRAIVFNGEIYNYKELREGLQARHRFTSNSDTEVILHLYEEKGTDVSRYLKGDFAFCIWDSNQESCFLSRDHLGVKPLFYSLSDAGDLIFSSELAALLRHPDVPTQLDLEAALEFLTCLYISAPRTLIQGVYKLRPGESLLWRKGSVRTWKYWHLPKIVNTEAETDVSDFRGHILDLLRTAVRRRLIADVPVGAFLSGGIDSSLIVALASQECRGLQTFSIGYDEADFDELRHARRVSRQYGTDHHEFVLKPDVESLLEQVISAMDEPIADSSAIPTYLIAAETRRFVKVALSGIGGDELFSGYPRYLGARLSEKIPSILKPPLSRILALFSSRPAGRDVGGWIQRFGYGLTMPPMERYWSWTTFLDARMRDAVFPYSVPETTYFKEEAFDIFTESPGDFLDKVTRLDVTRYLASDLLKFGDNMTMAHSLELRVPFCDVDLVTAVLQIPARIRFPGYKLKPLLKDIARQYLPEQIIKRRKQGFMVPVGKWFRHELAPYLQSHLYPDSVPSFLDAYGIAQLLKEHLRGDRNHTHLLWALLVLTRWLALHPNLTVPAGGELVHCNRRSGTN